MLRTDDLDYHLPPELVATFPASPRDSARLMVLSRSDPARLEHRVVRDLPEVLRPGDLLVVNTTRVLPARFRAVREDSGGRAEGLYLSLCDESGRPAQSGSASCWAVLIKSRRQGPGVRYRLESARGEPSDVSLVLLGRHPDEAGGWVARVERAGTPTDAGDALHDVGLTPLPPYILQRRKEAGQRVPDDLDRSAYQTVYAREAGSVAAPTAGLHFTDELLSRLEGLGVRRASVVLHVGTGTFKPVETEHIEEHPMHREWCEAPRQTLELIAQARREGGRVIAVGTTSARTLESLDDLSETPEGKAGWTRLLITPGRRWRCVDGLLTNFHLPRSTLLAMVAALLDRADEDGVKRLRRVYAEAIERRYRFYSFGDAMLILP